MATGNFVDLPDLSLALTAWMLVVVVMDVDGRWMIGLSGEEGEVEQAIGACETGAAKKNSAALVDHG